MLKKQKNNVLTLKNLWMILLKKSNNLKKNILTKLEVSIILRRLSLLSVLDWLFFSGTGLWPTVDRLFMKNLNQVQPVQRKNRIISKCVENSSWRIYIWEIKINFLKWNIIFCFFYFSYFIETFKQVFVDLMLSQLK